MKRKRTLKIASNFAEAILHLTEQEKRLMSAQRLFDLKTGKVRKRGKVSGFSFDSRSRLLRLLNSLRLYDCDGRYMVTLTYGKQYPEWATAKYHLDNFCNHFLRRYFREGVSWFAIWRLEIQRRDVPHFHLVLYCESQIDMKDFYEKALLAWMKLIGLYSPQYAKHSVHLKRGFTLAYLAGHTGKENQVRDWHFGRWWGVVNRKCLDTSPFAVFEDLEDFRYYKILRVLRKYKETVIKESFAKRSGDVPKIKLSKKHHGIKCVLPLHVFQFQLKKWIETIDPF